MMKTAQNPSPTTGGNWWDKLGKPQYGGEISIRASRNIVNFDPYFNQMLTTIQTAWKDCTEMIGHWIRRYSTTNHAGALPNI